MKENNDYPPSFAEPVAADVAAPVAAGVGVSVRVGVGVEVRVGVRVAVAVGASVGAAAAVTVGVPDWLGGRRGMIRTIKKTITKIMTGESARMSLALSPIFLNIDVKTSFPAGARCGQNLESS